MKYDVMTKYLLPLNHPNRRGTKLISPRALVIHWTANLSKGADDIANAKYFGRAWERDNGRYEEKGTNVKFRYGSAHYIVDQDSIQNTIPEDEIAYHVGNRRYTNFAKKHFLTTNGQCYPNAFTIGIEMCVNAGSDWSKTCELTAELASDIMIRNNIGIDMLIRHYDVTGKDCPRPFVSDVKAWMAFKNLIAQKIAEKTGVSNECIFKDIEDHWAKEIIEYMAEKDIVKGDNSGYFYPNRPMTRAEGVTILYKALTLFEKVI
ncbi:N-acetylmuramoyl-L-alanine amidase [Crassaminicella profunda]|uniref:N-acetylmuramoyl-L-alanine amidase n=1 Tax=Crassaminicella profunda TaxID=1286698 RepID=UPI001CA6472B|nr:N-acetylmuramoyl-L-alanine amidase [Crassaminicella profunda]QZY57175.1 N-acetylmuramoyl-L-alanine amidase [Crassaminicella profunda]